MGRKRRGRREWAAAGKRYPGGGSDFFCAIFCEFVQEPRVAEAGEEQGGRRDGGEKKAMAEAGEERGGRRDGGVKKVMRDLNCQDFAFKFRCNFFVQEESGEEGEEAKKSDGVAEKQEGFVWPWVRIFLFYKSTYVGQIVALSVRLRFFPEKAGIAARRTTSVGSGAPVQVLGLY